MDGDGLTSSERRWRRVILYGGSFDPPQVAHVALPMLAREAVGADVVLYMPTGRTPMKEGAGQTSAIHRLAMLRLALAEQDWAVVRTDEVERGEHGEVSYTVDTLERLRAELGDGVEIRLLMGTDQALKFDQWRRWERVLQLARPLVLMRPPEVIDDWVERLPAGLERAAWGACAVTLPCWEVSSTVVRERVKRGLAVGGLVHPAVADYVRRVGLYRNDA